MAGLDVGLGVVNKKRSLNWGARDVEILMEEVEKRINLIEGRFCKQSGGLGQVTKKKKDVAWQEIANAVNSFNLEAKRTAEECRKKFQNVKQSARNKVDLIKRPPTGGGPVVAAIPTAAEETYLRLKEGAPSLEGITGGSELGNLEFQVITMDELSDMGITINKNIEKETDPTLPDVTELISQEAATYETTTVEAMTWEETHTTPSEPIETPVKTRRKSRCNHCELEEDLMRAEIADLRSHKIKNDLQSEVLQLQKQILILELKDKRSALNF